MTTPIGPTLGPQVPQPAAKPAFGPTPEELARKALEKFEFLQHLMRTVPPGLWSLVGDAITEMVLAAAPDQFDKVKALVMDMIRDLVANHALDQVDQFLAAAGLPAEKETK